MHIPYCSGRCAYCDFYSTVAQAVPEGYIDALLRDFERFVPRDAAGVPLRPATVYFGGGTPGLLRPAQVARLMQAANPLPTAEVTLELNPEQATPGRLAGWLSAGVNRLSVGVQSACDAQLRRLGRRHTAADAARALRLARAAGFNNLSGDMMLALPGDSRQAIDETVALLAAETTHISAYLLKLERGTPMGAAPPPGLPDADEAAELYRCAVDKLAQAGYARYEISNFARPGFEGRHNLIYWDAGNWLGLGPSAHSCLSGRRFSFAANLPAMLRGASEPVDEGELEADDYIMLRLRLDAGLDEAALERRFGRRLSAGQQALLSQLATADLATRTLGGWALTTGGMLVQNEILVRLLDL